VINFNFSELSQYLTNLSNEFVSGQYTTLYSTNVGAVSKTAFVSELNGLQTLLNLINSNPSELDKYVAHVPKINDQFILQTGYTITTANNICRAVPNTIESWNVLQLRVEVLDITHCVVNLSFRIKSRR
jgi:hypothetical protein